MTTILDQLAASTRARIEGLTPLAERGRAPLDFRARLTEVPGPSLIMEIKRASPSQGEIAPGIDAVETALRFAAAGARAISVLTEPSRFGGSEVDLVRVREALPEMPLLMKDFILDPRQIDRARALGADAILLIHALLGPRELRHFLRESSGLTALVEVHTANEMKDAIDAGAGLIGVNNRDLRTLKVDLDVARELARLKPDGVTLVCESGLRTREQIEEFQRLGYDSFLIGTRLMENQGLALGELTGGVPCR